jgi:hypothetical protein
MPPRVSDFCPRFQAYFSDLPELLAGLLATSEPDR